MSRNPDSFDADEMLADLGVEIPWPKDGNRRKGATVECGQKAPTLRRHTDWSNEKTFEFTGYIAMITQTTCECCGSMRENLEGIFMCETKISSGARRLQAIASNGDWPAQGDHTCEVKQLFSRFCPDCVRGLGFTREVEAAGTMNDITIRG